MFADWEKKVFEYEDGSGDKAFADPVEVNRLLVHHLDGDPDKFLRDRWAGFPEEGEFNEDGSPRTEPEAALEPVRFEAERRLSEATALALDLVLWDKRTGKGLTTLRVLEVLDQYLEWMDVQKKSAECSPIMPTPTAGF